MISFPVPIIRRFLLLILLPCMVIPLMSEETGTPWDPFNGEHVAGEFGGARTSLNESDGISLTGESTDDLLGEVTGGRHSGSTLSGLLALVGSADLQKAAGWGGGSFKTTWLWFYGSNLSQHFVGNGMTVSSIAGNPAFLCNELWLQQSLFKGALSLKAGLLCIGNEFMTCDSASSLVNSTFTAPVLFTFNAGGAVPATTLQTPGFRVEIRPGEGWALRSVFAQVDPLSGQSLLRGPGGWVDSGGGYLSLCELDRDWKGGNGGLAGTFRTGLWFEKQKASNLHPIEGEGGFPGFARQSPGWNSGYYGLVDQTLFRGVSREDLPLGEVPRISVFSLSGFSPQNASPVSLYTQAGVLASGCIPNRRSDKLSLGFAWARLGQDAIGTAARNSWPGAGYESVLEGTWVVQITPAFTVQPDLQYVIHPGATERYGNSLVIGLRAVLEL